MQKNRKKQILVLLILLLVCFLLYFFSGKILALIRDVDGLKHWLASFGSFQYLIFVLFVSLQVIVAIIPGGPYQIAGGYLYGTWLGTALCVIGCSIGSMIVFLLVRRYGMRIIKIFISEESIDKTRFITESPKCRLLLAVCFIIPGTPKDVISYIAGLTNISFWHWALICSVGRLPGIFLSVFAGHAFRKNNYLYAVIAFCVLAVICLAGSLIYKKLEKKQPHRD